MMYATLHLALTITGSFQKNDEMKDATTYRVIRIRRWVEETEVNLACEVGKFRIVPASNDCGATNQDSS